MDGSLVTPLPSAKLISHLLLEEEERHPFAAPITYNDAHTLPYVAPLRSRRLREMCSRRAWLAGAP
jgi:hypothetical protein